MNKRLPTCFGRLSTLSLALIVRGVDEWPLCLLKITRWYSRASARVALTFEGQIILNLEGETVVIVNLCMVRRSNEVVNFQGKGMFM